MRRFLVVLCAVIGFLLFVNLGSGQHGGREGAPSRTEFSEAQKTPTPAVPAVVNAQKKPEKPEWQRHLDWAMNNNNAGGSCDCVKEYVAAGMWQCVISGGRSCVMSAAGVAATARPSDDDRAYQLSLLTECHNGEATRTLETAGRLNVANYLRQRR
jgi:hypothetical protein